VLAACTVDGDRAVYELVKVAVVNVHSDTGDLGSGEEDREPQSQPTARVLLGLLATPCEIKTPLMLSTARRCGP
jgi:hypothetical protein